MRISKLVIATLFALWMLPAAADTDPQADTAVASEDSASASQPDESAGGAGAEAALDAVEGEAGGQESSASDADALADAASEGAATPEAEPLADADAAPVPAAPAAQSIQAGVGYDAEGRRGYVHVVQAGDTLWDISETYLTTPWVWPSIWKDNPEVANPHLIYPGDHLWISPAGIRRISVGEAAELLAGEPLEEEIAKELAPPLPPAALEEPELVAELPVAPPVVKPPPGRKLHVSNIESVGLVTAEQDRGASSIIERRNRDRIWLGQPDEVYIGLGQGEAEVGDHFQIYRKENPVYDVDDGRFVGYYVRLLGWLEVSEVFPESSLATIRMSASEIVRGDRLVERGSPSYTLMERPAPGNVDGRIIFLPDGRTVAGSVDYVFLNRGSLHGLDPGITLEVYRPGYSARDVVRSSRRRLPPEVVATITVVKAHRLSAVARVSRTRTELELGDRVRATR